MPVPLDRAGAVPGTIGLSIERRTAPSGPSPVAVLALAGGPGQAVLPLASFIAEAVAPALATRDLLLFDQRGTGASGPLSCAALTASEVSSAHSLAELIEHCARQLGPARGAYTTRESVEDIEAIRRAAGYERLVLYGTSYGTKVALEYAQRYPQHVESLVLDSTETPEGPEPFHVDTFKAMRPMLAELCSHGACNGVSSTPLSDIARLAAATSARPLKGTAFNERGGSVSVSISSQGLFALLLDGDLNPVLRAELPAAVHSALHGDTAALARLLAPHMASRPSTEEPSGAIDQALFIDTSCEETPFPWQRGAPETTRAVEAEAAVNALPASDFYPFDAEAALLDMTIPLCVAWPDASPAPATSGALPNVPTLILSGGQDLRTPTLNAQRVASLIPDAQIVKVPYTGHSVIGSDLNECARAALAAFFAGASEETRQCAAAVNHFPPAPLAPTRLSSVTPTPGVGGARGRTLAAALDTVLDLRRTIIRAALDAGQIPVGARIGGLRGGTVRLTTTGVVLSRLSYVPGVQLSGVIPGSILLKNTGTAANLTIAGAAASPGRLRIASGGRLTGVLAGRALHVNVSARVRVAGVGPPGGSGEWLPPPTSFPLAPLAHLR